LRVALRLRPREVFAQAGGRSRPPERRGEPPEEGTDDEPGQQRGKVHGRKDSAGQNREACFAYLGRFWKHIPAMQLKPIIIVLAVVAVFAAAYAIYQRRNSRPPEPKYRTEAVDKGNVSEVVTATGTISAVTTVQVGSQVSGIIAKLYADYNSPVKKGQLLAEL